MVSPRKLFCSAGELSGEEVLCKILDPWIYQQSQIRLYGWGGFKLSQLASKLPGSEIQDVLRLSAVQGVWDVLFRLPVFVGFFLKTVWWIHRVKPHLILLVDYPGLHELLLKWFKNKYRFYFIAPPQVWAYRARSISHFQGIHCLLYFKKDFPAYEKVGAICQEGHFFTFPEDSSFQNKSQVLLMCPGSRARTFARNLPLYIQVVLIWEKMVPNSKVLWLSPTPLHRRLTSQIPFAWITDSVEEAIAQAKWAVAFPGSMNLTLALHHIPTWVTGSIDPLTYWMGKRKLSISSLSLPNLLSGQTLFQETYFVSTTSYGHTKVSKILARQLEILKNSQITWPEWDKVLGPPQGPLVARKELDFIFQSLN